MEPTIAEIQFALSEINIIVSVKLLESLDKKQLKLLQKLLFDVKKIKKEMADLLKNNAMLSRIIIECTQEKLKLVKEQTEKKKASKKVVKDAEISR